MAKAKEENKEILYSTENYLGYKEDLENAISDKTNASIVNSGVIKDPVTSFKLYHHKAKQLMQAKDIKQEVESKSESGEVVREEIVIEACKLPTEDEVFNDPQQTLTKFLHWILSHKDISHEDKKEIQKQVTIWSQGEKEIYHIVAKSLKQRKNFTIKPAGAGRKQLANLENTTCKIMIRRRPHS